MSFSPRMRASAAIVAATAGLTTLGGFAVTANAATPVAAVHQAVKTAAVKAAPASAVTTASTSAQTAAAAAAHLAYLNKEAAIDAQQAYYAATGRTGSTASSAYTPAASAPAQSNTAASSAAQNAYNSAGASTSSNSSAQQNSDAASAAQNAYNSATASSGSTASSSTSSSSASDAAATSGAATSGDPQAIAAAIVPADQLASFDEIISHESGWDVTAVNPSSGAYGLPQALPGDKMASVGADWQTDATTQIEWALQYMDSTYGSPNQAWAFWQANNWY